MELNINSPAYYSSQYGIDDDVYRYCQNLYMFFKDKEYSETLNVIGIVPVVAPEEEYNQEKWKEGIRFISNGKCASITIRMNYIDYHKASSSERILMIRDMLLNAVKKVKTKGKFDYDKFCADLDCCKAI